MPHLWRHTPRRRIEKEQKWQKDGPKRGTVFRPKCGGDKKIGNGGKRLKTDAKRRMNRLITAGCRIGRKMLGRKMEGSKWQRDGWQKDGPERGTEGGKGVCSCLMVSKAVAMRLGRNLLQERTALKRVKKNRKLRAGKVVFSQDCSGLLRIAQDYSGCAVRVTFGYVWLRQATSACLAEKWKEQKWQEDDCQKDDPKRGTEGGRGVFRV